MSDLRPLAVPLRRTCQARVSYLDLRNNKRRAHRPLEFANTSIIITHGKDNKLRAFHNVCTHRGTQLVQEPGGKRASFTCPYDGWNFGNDGELRQVPDFDRFYLDKKDCALRPVAVDACAGLIFVNLDPRDRGPLQAQPPEQAAPPDTQ